MIGSCQEIPTPKLLTLESLGYLVLDDACHPSLYVLQDVTELKLPLERCCGYFLSSEQSMCKMMVKMHNTSE